MKENLYDVKLQTMERGSNNEYINLYVYIDGKRFELVPHCRTIRETAYFYSMLKKSKLASAD